MEVKYNIKTAVFVEQFRSDKIVAHDTDFIIRMNNYEGLHRWESMKRGYEEMLSQVKI